MLIPYFLNNLGMGGGGGTIYTTSPFAAEIDSCSSTSPAPAASMFTWTVVQGQGSVFLLSLTYCSVDSTGALTGSISTGSTDAALLTFTPNWSSAGAPHVVCSLTSAQTAALPPGGYIVQIGLAAGTGELAYGVLNVAAAPSNLPTYDLLTTPAVVLSQCPEIASNPTKVAALPNMLLKATQTIRRYCNCTFTRRVFTEYLSPTLEGEMMLQEMPINRVSRISWKLQTAIEITADSSVYQVASVDYDMTDNALPNPFNVTYTGVNLTGYAAGVASSNSIAFSSLTTINDLATAVNALSGWTATINDSSYANWPIGELYCDGTSQGAIGNGVQLQVFSEDVSTSRLDRKTGSLYVPNGFAGTTFGPRWGPDWMAWNNYSASENYNVVRVTYDAGYTAIPPVVQQAAVEIVKVAFNRLDLDYARKRETVGEYSYELRDNLNLSIPDPVRQDLAPFVIHRA